MSGERGTAALELALGVCVLVVPAVLLVSALPSWLERESVASLMAREVARVWVLADDTREAAREGRRTAARLAADHGYSSREFSVRVTGSLRRGGTLTAEVRTTVPVTRVPVFGRIGRFTLTRRHAEVVDPYRSW